MSMIWGLLFNRYSLLILAFVIVAFLVSTGRLLLNKYTIGGLVLLALGIGLWTGIEKWEANIRASERAMVVAEYNAKIDAQKSEARQVLAKVLAENAANLLEFSRFKTLLEKDREKLQSKNAADLRAARAGPRLQFTTQVAGCGPSGVTAKDGAPGAASDAGTTVVQLPQQISDDLHELAADAQSVLIDYGTLYAFVHNPKMTCELRAKK